jgi:hypothetical protein
MKKLLIVVGGLVGLLVIAVVALIVVQGIRSDDANLATEAPPITGGTGADVGQTGGGTSSTGAGGRVRRFVIVREESEAKYVVQESLRGFKSNAVGTTKAIDGEINLSEAGLDKAAPSTFRVDLSTLQSDEERRDNYIKQNTLQTDQYQYADFTIDSVTGFPADYVEDTQVELSLSSR